MSLRARLTLAIVLLVGVTALFGWAVTGRAVVRPYRGEVMRAWLDQAVTLAERVEAGQRTGRLERRLGVEVERIEGGPPPWPRRGRSFEMEGRRVHFRPGPRARVVVEIEGGWLVLHRDVDLGRPSRRLGWMLLIGGLGIVVVASGIAARSVRPVDTARAAMSRIARGDLAHRLPEEGPPELREMARTFNHMAEEVARRLRAERELMAGISHELRTPLARMRLELELLRDAGAPEGRIAAVEGDIEHVDALIGELVELSRMEFGEVTLDARPLDLGVLAREAASGAGARVVGEGRAVGDPRLLRRALDNLLSNAARYAPGAPVTIAVSDGRFAVEDEGPGVPDDALADLFEPFWRGEGSRSRATGGLGLGLMIVRQVARLHGGRVWAENREGGGLRVVLALGGDALA